VVFGPQAVHGGKPVVDAHESQLCIEDRKPDRCGLIDAAEVDGLVPRRFGALERGVLGLPAIADIRPRQQPHLFPVDTRAHRV